MVVSSLCADRFRCWRCAYRLFARNQGADVAHQAANMPPSVASLTHPLPLPPPLSPTPLFFHPADQVDRVVFCLFNEPNISIYRALMPYYFPPDEFERIPAAVDSGVGEEAVADAVDPPEAADGGGAVEPELAEMDAAVADGGDLGSA